MAERIGVIGLGRMGRAIAAGLAGAGFDTTGWNRSPVDPSEVSVPLAPDLASLVVASDIVILSLFDDIAVTEVMEKLLTLDLSGKLIADTSTVRPETLRGFAARLGTTGACAVDAPISGGPEMVAARTAGMFLGGAEADIDRFRPAAGAIAGAVRAVGPLGAGVAAKIANNILLAGSLQALKEAVQTGLAAGLDLRTLVTFLSEGPAANGFFRARLPEILGDSERVGFPVAGALKDIDLFLDVAGRLGVNAPATAAAKASFEAVADKGFAEQDVAMVIRDVWQTGHRDV
ncbi:NAD(P)-dependent oxidoreductase [Defluviimonas sp. SAOS-178_SWC]|uniref:NAD(P)-dependent oxidoreductase n=1 Tax=Defluviimonas sp. SAOS-178_SWC TaxID=3121287 RepID=UPI003221CC48